MIQNIPGVTDTPTFKIRPTWYTMEGRIVSKLFAVTLRRSRIGRPWWIRRTLDSLGLKKTQQTVICKNTPSVNGQLKQIKDMIKVTPVVFRTDIENSPNGGEMLLDNGHFYISEETLKQLKEEIEIKS